MKKIILLLFMNVFLGMPYGAFAQETTFDITSNVGTSATGAIGRMDQIFVSVPPERDLKMPFPGPMAGTTNLFFDLGATVNANTAFLYWFYTQVCRVEVSAADLSSARMQRIEGAGQSGTTKLVFEPHRHYATVVPDEYAILKTSIARPAENLDPSKQYVCLGTLFVIGEKDEEKADVTTVHTLTKDALVFATKHLWGFPLVYLLTTTKTLTFERELSSNSEGFGVTPQGAGIAGSILLGLPFNYSSVGANAGMFARAGTAFVVVAEAQPQWPEGIEGSRLDLTAWIAKGREELIQQKVQEKFLEEKFLEELKGGNGKKATAVGINKQ